MHLAPAGILTATGIGYAIFLPGCAYGHFRDISAHGNLAPYNVGPVLWFNDLVVPLAIVLLLLVRRYLTSSPADPPVADQ